MALTLRLLLSPSSYGFYNMHILVRSYCPHQADFRFRLPRWHHLLRTHLEYEHVQIDDTINILFFFVKIDN